MTTTDTRTHTHIRTDPTDWVGLAHEIGVDLEAEVAEADRAGRMSTVAFDRLRVSGVTAALVPAALGGGGASHADMGALLRTLATHDPATAVTLSMHSHVVAMQVWRHNKGMDAAPFFAKVVEGAVAVSTGASDWVASNGSARRVDGGFRVSARKAPVSGCEVADIAVTSIRWDEGPDGPQVIHCAVPLAQPGVEVDLTWDTLGLRATGSHTLVFDDVFVPDTAVSLIRPADVWHPVWNTVLGAALPLIMAAYVGIADVAVETALAAVAGRADAHVQQLAGEMVNAHTTGVDVAAAMLADSDNLRFEASDAHAARILSRKSVVADALIDTVRLAIEVTGGMGYSRKSNLERLYRDVHGSLFHPLPRAKQTRLTGRVALDLPPIG